MGFNMPYQDDKASLEGNKGSWSLDFYRPLPEKAKQTHRNSLIIPLFSPNYWKLFNPTPEVAQKYQMAGAGGLISLDASNPLETFYLRVPVHGVRKFVYPDGKTAHANVICPISFNRYLTETLGKRPFYTMPRCAFCEEADRMWEVHNDRWESMGVDKGSLKSEGYWDYIKRDSILGSTHRTAKELTASDRCLVAVFDHDKFLGERKLDDGETGVHHQIWYAPKSVYTELWTLYENEPGGFNFFEPNPTGWPIVYVTKDTSECEGNNLRNTKYSVSFMGKFHPYPEDWTAYLLDRNQQVDPSPYLHQLTYEESGYYASQLRESSNVPQNSQVQVPPSYNSYSGGQPEFALPPGAPAMSAPPAAQRMPGVPQVPQAPTGSGGPPLGNPPATPPMSSPAAFSSPGGAVPISPPPPGIPPAAQPPVPSKTSQPQAAPIPQQPPEGEPKPPIPTAPAYQQAMQAQPPDRSAPQGGETAPGAKRRKW